MDAAAALDMALGAARSVDASTLPSTRAQRAGLVSRAQELRNAADGLLVEFVADLILDEDRSASGPVTSDGTDTEGLSLHGRIEEAAQTPEMIAPRLGMSVQQARTFCHTAVGLVQRAPQLVDEMRSGRLDLFRASLVHLQLRDTSAAAEGLVVGELVARAHEVGGWRESAGPLKRRARALLAKVDADFVAARAAVEREFRTVFRTGESEHLDKWTMLIPVEDSRQLFAAVDELAKNYVAADRADPDVTKDRVRTLDQARTDALVALVLDDVNLTLHLHAAIPVANTRQPTTAATLGELSDVQPATPVPAANGQATEVTLLDLDELPDVVTLTGWGSTEPAPVPAAFLRKGSANGRIVIDEPLLCDPATGALVQGDITKGFTQSTRRPSTCTPTIGATQVDDADPRYRVPEAIARFVKFRDRICRYPGCHVSARFTDLDHVIPWPRGSTTPANLICLCRRHHRLKQSPGWTVRLHRDGTTAWTDPTGTTLTSDPVDLLCVTRAPDPEPTVGAGAARTAPVTEHALTALEDLVDDWGRPIPGLSAMERALLDELAA